MSYASWTDDDNTWKSGLTLEKVNCKSRLYFKYKNRFWIQDCIVAYNFMGWAQTALGPVITTEVFLACRSISTDIDSPGWLIDKGKTFYIRDDLMPLVSLGWHE